MRLRRLLAGAIATTLAVGGALVLHEHTAKSADHLDSPATKAEAAADINDHYVWMDGNNVVLAMTVYPAAPMAAKFSNTVQYVFHTFSGAALTSVASPYDIICTFDMAQKASCWAGTDEYVTGDASAAAGLESTDKKFKVFAGLRADPFFFNLEGFKQTLTDVEMAAGGLTFNGAGCPAVDSATSAVLVGQLSHAADGGAPVDFFANFNALAIVVSIDKGLLTKGGKILGSYAATYNQ